MASAILRQWHLLALLPKGPRRVDTATLAARLRERGFVVHQRTIQRDLVDLARIFPIVSDHRSKPYGWRWRDGAALVCTIPAPTRMGSDLSSATVSHYRDPLAGLLSQVATKRGLALDREKRVTPVLRALLPSRIEQKIAEYREHALDESADSMEKLSRVDAALDALSSIYEEALMLEDDARTLAFEVSDPPRPDIPPPWLIEEESQLRFRTFLNEHIGHVLDAEIVLIRWGDFGYLTRFRREGAPHVLHVEAGLDSNKMVVVGFTATLRTTMPERVPELDLRAQGPHHSVAKALGLASELDTGDRVFDETFWIKGHRGALAFLNRELRGPLLALAALRPRLRFHRGVVSFEWSGPSDGTLGLELALDLVDRIHALVARG